MDERRAWLDEKATGRLIRVTKDILDRCPLDEETKVDNGRFFQHLDAASNDTRPPEGVARKGGMDR